MKKLFGKRLKSLRESKGWTQEYFSEKIDISPKYLSGIECGRENPTLDMLIKISKGLKVEMWELFDFEHEASPEKLRKMVKEFASDTDDKKIALAVKILRAIVR